MSSIIFYNLSDISTVPTMAPSNGAERARKHRLNQKLKPDTELDKLKRQTNYQKKRVKETTQRLVNTEYDEKLKNLNRARVKKFRDKNKTEGRNAPVSNQEDTNQSSEAQPIINPGPDKSGERLVVRLPVVNTTKSRQSQQGEKRRRETLRDKNISIEEFTEKVSSLEKDNEKLEEENINLLQESIDLKRKLETLKGDKSNHYKWFKVVWKYLTPEGRKEWKAGLHVAKEELPDGTLTNLRNHTGINFSNPLAPTNASRGTGELKLKVEKFAHENSFVVPDKKLAKKKVRYMRHMKTVLYHQFLLENPTVECHYSTFCAHFPAHIVKPGINSQGSCLCEDCENFSLKEEAIKREKLVQDGQPFNVDIVIHAARVGNSEPEEEYLKTLEQIKIGDDKSKIVTYFHWEDDKQSVQDGNANTTVKKRMIRKNIRTTAAGLASKTLEAYGPLKSHLHRDKVIKDYIRKMRLQTLECDQMVCLTIDWSENGILVSPAEVQTAFFGRASYSIQSGYLYSKDKSYGFADLTDANDHKAESVWTALTPRLEQLVLEGVKKFVISSDSTGAQYRNCKNCFLMKLFCQKYKVELVWIFTEKHHGKSPADGIGGNVKNAVEQLTSFSNRHNIQNAQDVTDLLKSTDTMIEVSHFNREDIETTLNLIPGVLNSLKGAMKLHEIFVNENGVIRVKELPTDDQYTLTNITVRNRRTGAGGRGMELAVARITEDEE